MLRVVIVLAAFLGQGLSLQAEPRVTLGWGRVFTNDQIGDGQDRWRTGSYSVSRVRGAAWHGLGALGFGDLLELRGHAAMIAPANLTTPSPADRRYAGMMSLGLNTHFGWKGAEVALGGELALTGPRTGIGRFHGQFHDLAGMLPPSQAVLGAQIGDKLFPGVNAEIGRTVGQGALRLRPFAEARAGVESLVRVGVDVTFGQLGRDDLMLRDVTTGQLYRAVEGSRDIGASLTLGADLAQVFDSALMPAGSVAAEDHRYRLRAGLHWQGKRSAVFYGASYLSPEFTGQPEGQIVGALSLNLRF